MYQVFSLKNNKLFKKIFHSGWLESRGYAHCSFSPSLYMWTVAVYRLLLPSLGVTHQLQIVCFFADLLATFIDNTKWISSLLHFDYKVFISCQLEFDSQRFELNHKTKCKKTCTLPQFSCIETQQKGEGKRRFAQRLVMNTPLRRFGVVSRDLTVLPAYPAFIH